MDNIGRILASALTSPTNDDGAFLRVPGRQGQGLDVAPDSVCYLTTAVLPTALTTYDIGNHYRDGRSVGHRLLHDDSQYYREDLTVGSTIERVLQ